MNGSSAEINSDLCVAAISSKMASVPHLLNTREALTNKSIDIGRSTCLQNHCNESAPGSERVGENKLGKNDFFFTNHISVNRQSE